MEVLECRASSGNDFRMWNPFLYQGQTTQVNARRAAGISHSVTRVTKREIHTKKGLLCQNGPTLKLPPRPGPGSSGQPVSGYPSTPEAGGPLLNFWGIFRFHQQAFGFAPRQWFLLRLCAGCGFVRREQALRAEPVFKQVGPLVERGIAFAQAAAVGAVHEYMQLRRNSGLQQRLIKVDGRCRRDRLVGKGLIDECRRRVFGDKEDRIVFGAERVALVACRPSC